MSKAVYIAVPAAILLLLLASKGGKGSKKIKHLDPAKIKPMTDEQIQKALKKVLDTFGRETAKNVEMIYRWETSHFKTDQGRKTFTAGMHPSPLTNEDFPFGWGSALTSFIAKYPQYGGVFALVDYKESGTGTIKPYIKFPTPEGAFMFLGYLMKNYRSNNRGAWYSNDPAAQKRYNDKTAGVTPLIVNKLV